VQRTEPPDVSASVIEPIAATPRAQLRLLASDDRSDGHVDRAASLTTVDVEAVVAQAYDDLAGRLRSFAIRATRDPATADDLVQETFLRLVVELRGGRLPDNLGGWLYRVLANQIVSRGRRHSVAERLKSSLLRRDDPPTPEEQALGNERDRILAVALSHLRPDARVAVLLAARGMGATEIGLVIHRTPAATRTYICRARLRLREALAEAGMVDSR
jgi:RNA polymerase sigma-70 factor (ECF subfamily)